MPILQYRTYRWNYERLSGELKTAFLRVWIKELLSHLVRGELPLHKLDANAKEKIKHILLMPFRKAQRN